MPASSLDIAARLAWPGFDLEVDQALALEGFTALFGPSGGGKSTLLRVIAGFEAAKGRIALGNEVWLDSGSRVSLPAHRRPVGFMFQDARLFPHLSVAGNLRYALKRRHQQGAGVSFDDVVAALDLAPLLDRRVGALSGGERQRVALGRTLLTNPRLLLLDEPLSALDAARKADILPYLEDLPRRFGIPTIYVTHSVEEVARLCDRTMVMADGRIHAVGPTEEILERLDLTPLMGAFEAGVVIEGRIAGHNAAYHLTHIDLGGQTLTVPAQGALPVGRAVRLRIRARDVALSSRAPEELSIQNALKGTIAVVATEPNSAFAEVVIDLGGPHLRSRITRKAADEMGLSPGMGVYALVKSASFDPSGSGLVP